MHSITDKKREKQTKKHIHTPTHAQEKSSNNISSSIVIKRVHEATETS